MKRIYLDYAATTPVHPKVLEAMMPYLTEAYGNPSSIHFFGQEARAAVNEARENVARLIGAWPDEIVFTSGGTESNNLALIGTAYANQHLGKHIVTSAVEHHAVLRPCRFLEEQGFELTVVGVDSFGRVDPDEVATAMKPGTILVSIMHANNEVGTLQPVRQIAEAARKRGILFHTDAVQTAGRIPVDIDELGADLLSMSAHKLYGPKGIGALYIRRGTKVRSFLHGGGQEQGRRASTENVPAIIGFGVAADLAREEMNAEAERLTLLRDRLIEGLLGSIEGAILNGHPTQRLPNHVNISVEHIESEPMAVNLDLAGIAASGGSACTTGAAEASHVLLAMGKPAPVARGALRFTLGRYTTEQDIDRVLDVLPKIVARLRSVARLDGV